MEFYNNLCTSVTVFSPEKLKTRFSKIQLPSLPKEQVEQSDAD